MVIDAQFLTSRLWIFSRNDGDVITNELTFHGNGQMKGLGVAETSWRLDADELVIMLPGDIPTTRFRLDSCGDTDAVRLTGLFELLPDLEYYHVLEPATCTATLAHPRYPLTLTWRQTYTKFLNERRIYTRFPFDTTGAYVEGQLVTLDHPTHVEAYTNLPPNGFCTMGAFSYSISPMHPGTVIGRYCSIAHGVGLMDHAHPTDRVTTSSMTYDPRFIYFARVDRGVEFEIMPFASIFAEPATIGHDVWIGADALLKSGVTIGTGAIVAARTIVTRDVPPYSVVAGAPATVRKMRFPDAILDRLMTRQWWDYEFTQLPRCWNDPERFLDELDASISAGVIKLFEPKTVDIGRDLLSLDKSLGA